MSLVGAERVLFPLLTLNAVCADTRCSCIWMRMLGGVQSLRLCVCVLVTFVFQPSLKASSTHVAAQLCP